MSIKYKLNRIHDNITHNPKPRYSVTTKSSGNIDLERLKKRISVMSSFTVGDVGGVMDNLIILLKEYLQLGYSVTIDDLGTFFVTAQVVKEIEDPEYIPAGSVKMKGISFRPATSFREDMESSHFVKIQDKQKEI